MQPPLNTEKHLYLYFPTSFVICKTPNYLSPRDFKIICGSPLHGTSHTDSEDVKEEALS